MSLWSVTVWLQGDVGKPCKQLTIRTMVAGVQEGVGGHLIVREVFTIAYEISVMDDSLSGRCVFLIGSLCGSTWRWT